MGEFEPAAPLILSLGLAEADQDRLDRLRATYFPASRNFLRAHVTMFHHLPGEDVEAIAAACKAAAAIDPFAVRVARLQSLGRGVALSLESEALKRVRAGLAREWADRLTAQDRQGWRPHVTVQNKVTPEVAKRTLAELGAGFAPWEVRATGLCLWWYRGGPWEVAGEFPFGGDR